MFYQFALRITNYPILFFDNVDHELSIFSIGIQSNTSTKTIGQYLQMKMFMNKVNGNT